VPPPYIDELGSKPELLDRISQKAKSIFWIGGDISAAAGEAISAKLELFTDLGSTEMGVFPILRKKGAWAADDWHWAHYHPALKMRFEHTNDDIYEAFIVRNPEWIQAIFKVFPDLTEFPTGDLFQKHPTRDGLWKHYGRADDLLVFVTSEKFHPTETERRISSHSEVAEALLVGTRRPRASLILRLKDGGEGTPDGVWNFIEEINKDMFEYVKVRKNMILVVQEEFLKTPKGSVRRKAMGELYEKELDNLYNSHV
jgi:acyl-CoA synthetase (AMP-forming)/AMP-acid ligase II